MSSGSANFRSKHKNITITPTPKNRQHIRFDDADEAEAVEKHQVNSKKQDEGIDTSKVADADNSNNTKSQRRKKKRKRAAITSTTDDDKATSTDIKQDKIFNGLILALSTDNKQYQSNTDDKQSGNNEDDQYNNLKPLKLLLQTAGATISPQVHKRVHYLICTQSAIDNLTQRIRQAIKRNVDIVNVDWIKKCIQDNNRVDVSPFLCNEIAREIMIEKEREKKMNSSDGKGNTDGYDSDIPKDDNAGWSTPIELDCCCVCHENGDDNCPWCVDCNINRAKRMKLKSGE